MSDIENAIRCVCPRCGKDEILCDVAITWRYKVLFAVDSIELEKIDDDYFNNNEEQDSIWYCSSCNAEIFVGSKVQFVEWLLTKSPGSATGADDHLV